MQLLHDSISPRTEVIYPTSSVEHHTQLKLKRADKAQQKDRTSGVWYAYHPCGGAITVKRGGELT